MRTRVDAPDAERQKGKTMTAHFTGFKVRQQVHWNLGEYNSVELETACYVELDGTETEPERELALEEATQTARRSLRARTEPFLKHIQLRRKPDDEELLTPVEITEFFQGRPILK